MVPNYLKTVETLGRVRPEGDLTQKKEIRGKKTTIDDEAKTGISLVIFGTMADMGAHSV